MATLLHTSNACDCSVVNRLQQLCNQCVHVEFFSLPVLSYMIVLCLR